MTGVPAASPTPFAAALGARLRATRQSQGLSLAAAAARTEGRLSGPALGMYERGERSVTVETLVVIAEAYDVPVDDLLPRRAGSVSSSERLTVATHGEHIVLDLPRLSAATAPELGPLRRYARAIQQVRGDWNGRVLSLRTEDERALAVVYGTERSRVAEWLRRWRVLRDDDS